MTETSENSFSFMGKDFSTFMENAKHMGIRPLYNDLGLLMELQCKNVEAMGAIGKGIIDAMQSFMRRQTDLMCEGIEEIKAMEKAAKSAGSADEGAKRQAEASKHLWEKAMANMQDGMDTMAKCNANAMELMTQCFEDNLKEWRDAAEPKDAPKQSKK